MHKILVISHGHPDFRIGGGEKAAYFLYQGYSEIKEKIQKAYFLAPSHIRFDGRIEYYKENEYFWNTKMTDFFFVKSETLSLLNLSIIKDFLETIKPDIVHLHHYLFLGLEFIKIVKKFIPNVKILLTLHEYIPICYNNGQMIKRNDNTLCYESNIEACHRCFPEIKKEWFFLRKHRFIRYFDYVDLFIAPSNFLKFRYIKWGLPEEKVVVIENGFPKFFKLPPRSIKKGEGRNKFGYFGQINFYKGLHIVLEGLLKLKKNQRKKIQLFINAPNLESIGNEIKSLIEKPLKILHEEGIVKHLGPYYTYEDMIERMRKVDWVILPSIWWENSPLVIQEAFGMGRPVLVSNIGGMAEKVRDGIDGFHIPVNDPLAWAEKMLELSDPSFIDKWEKLYINLPEPPSYIEIAHKHLEFLEKL